MELSLIVLKDTVSLWSLKFSWFVEVVEQLVHSFLILKNDLVLKESVQVHATFLFVEGSEFVLTLSKFVVVRFLVDVVVDLTVNHVDIALTTRAD